MPDMPTDPTILVANAKCISKCIPPGDQLPVLISLADAIANKTIGQLPPASAATLTDLVEIDDGTGTLFNLTLAQLLALVTSANVVKSSGPITLNNSTKVYSFAHGLGFAPLMPMVVFICIANDSSSGCVIGDVIRIDCGLVGFAGQKIMTLYSDLVNLTLCTDTAFVGGEGNYRVSQKSTGAPVAVSSFNNFSLVFHYS